MKSHQWIAAQQEAFELKYPKEFARDRAAAGVFVLSFPKSGRTWHRTMLGVYLAKLLGYPVEDAFSLDLLCKDAGLSPVVYSHNGANFMDWLPPDHTLVANPSLWAGKPVILLTRDPRDILVSAYYHARFRDTLFEGSISQFIRDPRVGIRKVLTAYKRWHAYQGQAASFEVTSYEMMHSHPEAVLRSCLHLAGAVEVDESTLRDAIEFCRFEKMQCYEETNFFRSSRLIRPSDDPRANKVRRGKIHGYRSELSEEDIAYIEAALSQEPPPFLPL